MFPMNLSVHQLFTSTDNSLMSFYHTISSNLSKLGQFWQEKVNGRIFQWNLIFIVAQVIYLVFKLNDLPAQVPLYYSLPWGESQLASATALFILPGLSLAFLFINNLLAVFYLNTHSLMSRLLIVFSLLFSCLSLISLVQIINLII